MYRKLIYIFLAAAIALFPSCKDGGGSSGKSGVSLEQNTGSLVVNVSSTTSRLILTDEDMIPHSYVITGQGPNNSTFSRTLIEEDSAEIQGLVFGDWIIFVEALNSNNVSIAGGETFVTVHTGETATCDILVEPFTGLGTLDIAIEYPDDVENPSFEITLERKGYDPVELGYELNEILNRAEVYTQAEAGYYTLRISLYDETNSVDPYVGGAVEVVRIAQAQITSETIEITWAASGTDPGSANPDDPEFPSPGAPEGSDAISASTNHSGKEGLTSPELNPLAGAAYVNLPQIGNYGYMNLSYPVEVPAGRAGMQPAIGLSYSSSGTDGLAGMGWSMSTGLGVISRTSRYGELYYDERDVFMYNGKRLVKVQGPENSETGTYRMEIESGFMRFELTGTDEGGVWHVYNKAGTITVFGENQSDRIYNPDDETKTYIWNFSRSYDLNGNYAQAVYDESDFELNSFKYLKEIRYTGNTNTATPARQWVRFTYKDREKPYVSTSSGFIMKMTRLLDKIKVGWDDPLNSGTETVLWDYKMVYETSEDSGRPLLKTVESSRNTTKPEFKYQDAEHSLVWNVVNNPDYNSGIDPSKIKYFQGDFNGDGKSDMVFFNPDTGLWKAAESSINGGYNFPTYGSRYRGYDSEKKIQFFLENATGDYNGDGRADIAFYLPETRDFIVAEHTGRNFNFRNYGRLSVTGLDIFKCAWFTGDYDGNGLSDTVLFDEETGNWWLMSNKGGSFSFILFSKHFQNLFRDDYSPNSNMDSTSTSDNSDFGMDRDKIKFLSGDFNGDGRTDISIYDSRSGRFWVAENYRDDQIGFRLEWKLYKEFTVPEQVLFSNDNFCGDFNGDGLSDLLLFDRSTGNWILGETGESTLQLKIFSQAPQFREITRWLQGDFNGDGRTDIGFYSITDNNFWIGEADYDGFRYRIYNNLQYGPDPDEVLKTPLPKDEVKIEIGSAAVADAEETTVMQFSFDANYNFGNGELLFPGIYTEEPGLLLYRKNAIDGLEDGWYYTESGDDQAEYMNQSVFDFNPESEDILIMNNGRPFRSGNSDGILYYNESDKHFQFMHHNSIWQNDTIGDFNDTDFSYTEDLCLTGNFIDNNISVIVSDIQGSEASLLADSYETDRYNLDIIFKAGFFEDDFLSAPYDFREMFLNYGNIRNSVFFFTGNFIIEGVQHQILAVDSRTQDQKWYAGTIDIDNRKVVFTELSPSASNSTIFQKNGYTGLYKSAGNRIIYGTETNDRPRFHEIFINEYNEIELVSYSSLEAGLKFEGIFDSLNNPVLKSESEWKYYDLTTRRLKDLDPDLSSSDYITGTVLGRNDLIDNYYPYEWIQGDYNGDGKTDIGIFHLGERKWYFANTTGTVPDLINEVKNGIGGTYKMEYANSSSLDNTGDDSVSDLPVNYKVCTKLTVEDGRGDSIVTNYEYAGGYAHSVFINGFKETDYFGFSEFKVIDALGGKTINTYYNVPYDDFRRNRALAGAIKESRFVGSDGKEYSRTEYEYKLHEINTPGAPVNPLNGEDPVSYLIEPVEVRKYVSNVLSETRKSNIVLTPYKYEMESKTESVTDHYSDAVHAETTVSGYNEYENLADTNETRLVLKRNYINTPNETTSEYEYDYKGNLTGETTSYTGTGLRVPDNTVFEYEYDDYGNKILTRNISGSPARIIETSYDDAAGLHQFVTEKKSYTGSIYIATGYTINYGSGFGKISQITDPNGNSTYFDFDACGRLFRQMADTDSGMKRVLDEYYYSANLPDPLSVKVIQYTGTTDPDIQIRVFADGMGRGIHTIKSAGPNNQDRLYTKTGLIVYDAVGRAIRKSQTHWAGNDEIDKFVPNGTEKNPRMYKFDASNRVTKVTEPKAFPEEPETSVSYTYNDPWETITEHSIGRSKRIIKNARGLVLYVEDSGIGDEGETVNAAMGFAYDIAGNRIKKMDLTGPLNPPGGDFGMDITIDSGQFNVGVKESSGSNICQWRYDGFGRVAESSDPDMGYIEYQYNNFGEVSQKRDGLDRIIQMSYDRLGRLTEKELPGDEGTVFYEYDVNAGSVNCIGKVVRIDDPSQTKVFSYDMLGRINKETRTIKAPADATAGFSGAVTTGTFVTTFNYDFLNRKRKIDYPSDPNTGIGISAVYSYSEAGVTGVDVYNNAGRKGIINNVLYNEFGQMMEIDRGNGTSTHYEYDIKGRLSNLVTFTETNSTEKKLQDVSYTFNIDNSIASIVNSPDLDNIGAYPNTVRYDYTYDGLNRLKRAEGQYMKASALNGTSQDVVNTFEQGFEYADNGNMAAKHTLDPSTHMIIDSRTYVYNDGNHATTSVLSASEGDQPVFQMQYDAVGNMTTYSVASSASDTAKLPWQSGETFTSKTMVYDSYNRLVQVSNPDQSNELKGLYWYDDQGFRVRKISRREINEQIRDVETLYPSMYFGMEKHRTTSGSEIADTSYSVNNIYLNGVRIAAVIPSGSARYYLTDQVDSVKVVVDDNGDAVTRMEYLPFGETWFVEGNESDSPKYNSQELDKETGLYYYNSRQYNAEIGRFVTADTVIDGELDTQGWNRYSYCKNNPIMYKDPTGHEGAAAAPGPALGGYAANGAAFAAAMNGGNAAAVAAATAGAAAAMPGANPYGQYGYLTADVFGKMHVTNNTSGDPMAMLIALLNPSDAITDAVHSADNLTTVVEAAIDLPFVQPGEPDAHGNPGTWCNLAADIAANDAGADTSSILNINPNTGLPDIAWTNANSMFNNAQDAAHDSADTGVYLTTPENAQQLANEGKVVLAIQQGPRSSTGGLGHGHVGVVVPNGGITVSSLVGGPLIGQAGSNPGVRGASQSFNSGRAVIYVALPMR
ncbi:MAG: hypothetical protein JW864_04270 [Spirochaetes bacterium]|nr:hypothetical protein [Spirochaetota bacterium]